ncbi:putative bacteriodes thetaiotaomicron symbiotic chitinase [Corchorus olitorius]|uniref:Bacteriodes thetaiotaomicron symbiotic chitinase n=1 Tax=Corchorus olitorius TaxID=93759 RepID=A0A1R3IUN7_9ROSI|nr:putative bacteriodes thetaiotaomicron symbiotic chitinase [Corchorus olitorius]
MSKSEDCGKGSCGSGTSCGNATFCSSGTSCGSGTIFCKSCGSGASACTPCGETGLKSWLESEFAACVGARIEVDGRVDSAEECLSKTTRLGLARKEAAVDSRFEDDWSDFYGYEN